MDWLAHAIRPDWDAPANVRALVTTRLGGVSLPPYDSFQCATHVGDDPAAAAANRALLRQALPAAPCWLDQVHGVQVVDAGEVAAGEVPQADAVVSFCAGSVCVVQTADCLPLLFASADGRAVAAAHAGWRGLAAGVIEATVARLGAGSDLHVWLGPAIGPAAFEVGDDVREVFVAADAASVAAFVPGRQAGKWLADIYMLARLRLQGLGVQRISGGEFCTVSDRDRFYSYRRDGVTGRMASLIWLTE